MQADSPEGSRWRWLRWLAAVAVSVAASWAAVPLIAFWNGTACNEAPNASNRNTGLLGVCLAVAIISSPWLVVALNRKGSRWSLIVGWAVGVSLLVGFGLTHLTVRSWAGTGGGFCF